MLYAAAARWSGKHVSKGVVLLTPRGSKPMMSKCCPWNVSNGTMWPQTPRCFVLWQWTHRLQDLQTTPCDNDGRREGLAGPQSLPGHLDDFRVKSGLVVSTHLDNIHDCLTGIENHCASVGSVCDWHCRLELNNGYLDRLVCLCGVTVPVHGHL